MDVAHAHDAGVRGAFRVSELKRVFVLEKDGSPVNSAVRRERLNLRKDAPPGERVATYVSVEELSESLSAAAPDDGTRVFLKGFFLEQAWRWVTDAVK